MEASANANELTVSKSSQMQLASLTRIPAVRQLMLLVGVSVSVAIGFAIVLWSQAPSYSPVFSDLEERDAAAVVEALRGAGIEYKVQEADGAILVRADRVHDARMELAAQGLPQTAASGIESMQDQSSFGVSQFMESARYQHALEAELARTIKSLRQVQDVRVHLALPKQSAFIRDRQRPSASVLLHLYGGQQLDSGQATAIVNLVASSIPAMQSGDVTLIDQFGRLLSAGDELRADTLTASQFKITRQLEERYRQRIEALLMPLLGPGRLRAQVVADLDFTQIEETRESFDPERTAVRSEQISEEQRRGGADAALGIPGALSNTPPEAGGEAPADATAVAAPVNSSRRSTRNFEVDKTISRTRQQPGKIRKLSVAVLIDDSAAAEGDGEGATGMTPVELERITALVREAVGFDAERGDTVEVVNAAFQPVPEPVADDGPPLWEQPAMRELFKQILGALLVLALAFGVVRPMLRNIVAPAPGSLTTLLPGGGVDRIEAGAQLAAPATGGLSYQEKVAAARNITGHDPARVAQVVRKWLDSDD